MVATITCNYPVERQRQQELTQDNRLQTLIPRLRASSVADEQSAASTVEARSTPGQSVASTALATDRNQAIDEAEQLSLYMLPDSEVIYSPSVLGFDTQRFVDDAGGYLSGFESLVEEEWLSGVEIVERVAIDNSTNPRILLALLEYRSNWVFAQSPNPSTLNYPLGLFVPGHSGLYKELSLIAKMLNIGYYGWKSGELTELVFTDQKRSNLDPNLNAGTAALLYLFSRLYKQGEFEEALSGGDHFLSLHRSMFGDPWERARAVEPILPDNLTQPLLELPFLPGERWSFTGGPHNSWGTGTPRGALDFAPITGEPVCAVSRAWVTASAAGVITRSERNILALDLDGDGFEGTGWVLVYLHIADKDRLPIGYRVQVDDLLGHPSCEGGQSTGTHVHIARKYNGEWLPADGNYPFVLGGWQAIAGNRNYEGLLVKGDLVITANPGGSKISVITRE